MKPLHVFHSCILAVLFFKTGMCHADENNPFLELLDESAYQRAIGRLNQILEEAEIQAKTKMPTTGASVTKVVPGSQATKLGIKPGSVISKLGNQKLWGNIPWETRNDDVSLSYTDIEGTQKTAVVSPGLIGVHYIPHHRPDLEYIRKHTDVEKPWRKHAIIGALRWELDPKVGETAWHHAIKKGYPIDEFSDYFAALFAMHRPEGPRKKLDKFMRNFNKTEDIPRFYLPGLINMLACTGELKHLTRLLFQENPYFPWLDQDFYKLHAASDGKPLPKESLLKRAKALHLERINDALSPLAKRVGVIMPYPLPDFFTQLPSSISKPKGYYNYKRFGQETPLTNLHLSATVTIQLLGRHEKWNNSLYFRLEEKNPKNPTPSPRYHPFEEPASNNQLLSAGFTLTAQSTTPNFSVSGSQVEAVLSQTNPHISMDSGSETAQNLSSDMLSLSQDRTYELQVPRKMQIDLIRIGNEAGIYLNEVCYYYMPVDPTIKEIAISFQISGVEVKFSDFSVWKLRD
ncbi:MAG: hypothetical protein GXP30_09030 [Verrucomicrobia bacterium]|nr:hypothetical protein [Verrucomicrobiota bacterium]